MADKETKLKLESTLNQIYGNDNLYNGSVANFIFYSVNYIYLNDIYLYPRAPVKIVIDCDYMIVDIDSIRAEITYNDINNFLINIKEEDYV